LDWLSDPKEIYRRSFETVRTEADLSEIPSDIEPLVVRLIHACGMCDIAKDLRFSDDVAQKGEAALSSGAEILVDSNMVMSGIIRARLEKKNKISCTLYDPLAKETAEAKKTTRSAAAVDLWGERIDGSIIAIGNAPTALFRLLEIIEETGFRPAAILAFPVGFIGAEESKEALIKNADGVPYITLRGRRGGSAMASAAINALAGGL
jgi:precorrin-8X/cobalt-precorrin-8 methylmutase